VGGLTGPGAEHRSPGLAGPALGAGSKGAGLTGQQKKLLAIHRAFDNCDFQGMM